MEAKVDLVGAGSAGPVVTRRLVDAGQRVLLLEVGGEDHDPAIHDVGRLGELALPDTQPISSSVPVYEPWMTGPATGFALMAGLVRSCSRGQVTLSGRDPDHELRIDLGALREEVDVDALLFSRHRCREIECASALAGEWGAREVHPGPQVRTEGEERQHLHATAFTYHQVGTCRMGSDDGAVVSPQLAVHGVEGLRVADAR